MDDRHIEIEPYEEIVKGGATVLKVGGGQFCERSEPKKFFDPPLFGQWGDKYCSDS